MNIFTELKYRTKVLAITATVFILYGNLCRLLGIYFFWESLTVGWLIAAVALLLFLIDMTRIRKQAGKKTVWVKIGIVISCLILAVKMIFLFVVPHADAYAAAKEYFQTDQAIRAELGEVKGFALRQTGSISISHSRSGETGEADLTITVKGSKEFKDYSVFLIKGYTTPWKVIQIR